MLERAASAIIAVLFGASSMAVTADSHAPIGHNGQWVAAFADEFDGDELDRSKWVTCYWWDEDGCTNLGNNELQWYVHENVRVADGQLRLTAKPERVRGYRGRTFSYTSGMVTSGRTNREGRRDDRFSLTYGFIEVRAKVPAGRGLWPAVWLLPSDHESKPEIDIMEILGHRPDQLELHYHYEDAAGNRRSVGHNVRVADLSRGWHVYGLEWSRSAIVWYLDGREVWRHDDAATISDEPMYLLLNLAVGGDWPGAPDDATDFPAHFLIDYIRVWRRAGS
jgi:beta-glucanase (GH16 family)